MTGAAILFDLDGVLVDSNPIAERQLRRWAERHGVPPARLLAIHHGRPTTETLRLVAPHLDVVAEARAIEAAEAEDTEGLALYPGAARLVAAIPPGRWAIATSGSRRLAATRLAHVGLPTPRVLVTADDVARGKPAPDPYLKAAAGLGLDPALCVVIEDAPAGVASAHAAGARVIAVTSTAPAAALAAADVVVGRLDDLRVTLVEDGLEIAWRVAV